MVGVGFSLEWVWHLTKATACHCHSVVWRCLLWFALEQSFPSLEKNVPTAKNPRLSEKTPSMISYSSSFANQLCWTLLPYINAYRCHKSPRQQQDTCKGYRRVYVLFIIQCIRSWSGMKKKKNNQLTLF